jgi:YVTN family beta-propeller protein
MRLLLLLPLLLFAAGDTQPIQLGPQPGGGSVVPTGQRVRPAGESLAFPGRPVDLVLTRTGEPGPAALYLKTNRAIVAVDPETWRVRHELPFDNGDGGSMHGIALRARARRLYVTTAQQSLREASIAVDGSLAWSRKIPLPGPGGPSSPSHPCGIALGGGALAWVCLSRNNSIGVVDLAAGVLKREIPVGVAPFDIVLMPAAGGPGGTPLAWVSNWGGRRPRAKERTASSSGTPVLVDRRGVAASGTVSLVDLNMGRVLTEVAVGLHPSDLELSRDGRRLYVANANSDTVSVIDTRSRRVSATLSVRPVPDLPFGSAPNALWLSPDGRTLYAANGGNNAVAVVDVTAAPRLRGFIPAGWYPGALVGDERRLYIANIKGSGGQEPIRGREGWNVHGHQGTVTRVEPPSPAALAAHTARVRADARVPQILRARERAARGGRPRPVPARRGEPSVFEHVFYVVKENRTYDQMFGDLPRGNRDPRLCIYPRLVSPNHHALAEQFVLLDNFYCNGVLSADGHSWVTEGNVTDHLEKSFGGFTRSYTFGDDPLTYSSSGFLWDNVLLHGLSFRNYGEMDYAEPTVKGATWTQIYRDFTSGARRLRFSQSIGIETLRRYSARDYPGWNMRIPDVLRADVFLRELQDGELSRREWPNFTIVYLPNDHTSGTSPGAPTPRAQVADNDLALGRVVEGISKSRFWAKSCIFVIEDDPQDGFDHVDGHRSICLVVSPYTRRGALVSQFYNQTSVIHTIERILGLPPMNQMDAMAPLMSACFTERPDFRPYTCLPNEVPLDEMNPPLQGGQGRPPLRGRARYWAKKSMSLPLHLVDASDEDTLNRILWHAGRGVDAPYPAHLAGAHGRGLKRLNLVLTGRGRDHD